MTYLRLVANTKMHVINVVFRLIPLDYVINLSWMVIISSDITQSKFPYVIYVQLYSSIHTLFHSPATIPCVCTQRCSSAALYIQNILSTAHLKRK